MRRRAALDSRHFSNLLGPLSSTATSYCTAAHGPQTSARTEQLSPSLADSIAPATASKPGKFWPAPRRKQGVQRELPQKRSRAAQP